MDEDYRIALLIDADNTQLSKIGAIIQELSAYGRIVVKRAYGNWKKNALIVGKNIIWKMRVGW